MMKIQIHHFTQYTYSKEVFLEPHYLRFYPQLRPYLIIEDFSINIDPEPDGLFRSFSFDNTIQFQCWYNRTISKLMISVDIQIISNPFNPFDFFVDNNQNPGTECLKIFLDTTELLDEVMNQFLASIPPSSDKNFLEPVNYLLQFIHENWNYQLRFDERLLSPSECFRTRSGSCRDLSWLMINLLRSVKIPARFVSGYAFNPELGEGHELHAWVECWVPGAGWIGVDPSAGSYTNEAYIPVSCSHIPQNTLPVSGTFRGKANSRLSTSVTVKGV